MKDSILKRYVLKNLKLENYKKDYRLKRNFPDYLNDVLIGLLLSDGCLERSSETSNVRLSINMSMKNYPYIFHLYNLFEPYIDTHLNILDVGYLNNFQCHKNYSTVRFKTISMPQLLYYYNIFYKRKSIDNVYRKIVPDELNSNFNKVSLVHLIMGHGNYLKERDIIRIYTNSFTKNNVILLSNIINKNLCINSKVIHDRKNQYIIIIEKFNISLIREILFPHMHPSMMYKLGIESKLININKFDYLNIINNI